MICNTVLFGSLYNSMTNTCCNASLYFAFSVSPRTATVTAFKFKLQLACPQYFMLLLLQCASLSLSKRCQCSLFGMPLGCYQLPFSSLCWKMHVDVWLESVWKVSISWRPICERWQPMHVELRIMSTSQKLSAVYMHKVFWALQTLTYFG